MNLCVLIEDLFIIAPIFFHSLHSYTHSSEAVNAQAPDIKPPKRGELSEVWREGSGAVGAKVVSTAWTGAREYQHSLTREN